jgi:hypothetical protein
LSSGEGRICQQRTCRRSGDKRRFVDQLTAQDLIALVSIWQQAAATRRPTVIAMGCTWRKLRF